MYLIEFLPIISVLISIIVILAKIGFLVYLFCQTKQISALSYLIYAVFTSFPVGYVTYHIQRIAINKIQNDNGMLWLGETVSERITYLLLLVRSFGGIIQLVELILFIWLIVSLVRNNR